MESGQPLDSEMHQFVASLLEQPEVNVIGAGQGPVGRVIHGLFSAAQKVIAFMVILLLHPSLVA